jgi:hypothetical protein
MIRVYDRQLTHIHEQIDIRRQQLLSKQTSMKLIAQQNQFLAAVKHDYDNYYAYIAKQHQEQHDALALLNKYLDDLKHTDTMSESTIYDLSNDQKMIIEEMKRVRSKLKSIVQ